jgi:sigma-B regulation protein RsbU (phosphoserine phosphatase)
VGGDYFDAIPMTNSTTAFCIGDVAGKGLPAALLMSNMQASVRGFAPTTSSPSEMCSQLNRFVLKNTRSDRLTTFFYGVLDTARQTLCYSNAGHIPPFVVRQDGTMERLWKGGIVFGVRSDEMYEQAEITFGPGDRLVLLTDGITEAVDNGDEEFGEGRVKDVLSENRHQHTSRLHQKLLDTVQSFAVSGFHDDATLVTVSLR